MADRYRYNRDPYGREERGPLDRAGDEVRSWFGDEEASRRRRMDEQARERWEREGRPRDPDDRWRTESRWADERSYSSGRAYGDRPYGRPGEPRDYDWSGMPDRDYGWRSEPAAATYTGQSYGPYEHPRPRHDADIEYGRQAYGGPYGRERHGAREWSSTEGWRVPGPHAGRGPRGYQRTDDRIRDEINERLTAHGLIDATEIDCRVANGEVTLTGFVDSRAAKRAAEDVAEDVYGVREVHNQLRVRSHADDEGVGRTSVLGLTESRTQTTHPTGAAPADPARSRTRS